MSQIELAAKEVVFHFNKKHLEDSSIPMWVLKIKGETYYVNHVDCRKGFSTKETPDNSHTKGALKIRDCLVTFDADNTAVITELTMEDRVRLGGKQVTRVITSYGKKLKDALVQMNATHSHVKSIGGGCSTTWYVTDVYGKNSMLMLDLAMQGTDLRTLKANEEYYRLYEKYKDNSDDWINEDEIEWDEDDLYEN